MGRASKRNPIADPPADEGEPGHIYFEYPRLVEIASKKPQQVHTYNGRNNSNWGKKSARELSMEDGNCRLASSHTISGYTPPKDIEYLLGRWPTKDEVADYFQVHRVQGFGRGAIICRRHQPIEAMPLLYKWGFVSFCHQFSSSMPFSPYFVRWFDDNGHGESAWAEDLVLVHAAIDYPLLQDIMMQQDVHIPDRLDGRAEL